MVPEEDKIKHALQSLLLAIRKELSDEKITYTIGDRSVTYYVTYYGEGLAQLIAATLYAENLVGRLDK